MGLVQNLKKKFNNWVENTLVELSYLYMLVKVKQTTKKPGNYLRIESSQNNLTTERQSSIIATSSQDISEKITMKPKTTDEIVAHAREWAIDKIESSELCGEKIALYAEFEEWIELDDVEHLDIISLEQNPE